MTQTRAMLCALTGFFMWVLMDVGVKLGSQYTVSPLATMAALGIVGSIGAIAMAWSKGEVAALYPRRPYEQAAICLFSLIINYTFIISLKHLPLTVYYIVAFTSPLVVAALSSILKHEKLSPTKIICLIAGFVGVVIAIGWHGGGEIIGYAAGFVSVLGFSFNTVLSRRISDAVTTESILLSCFASAGIAGLIGVWRNDVFPHGAGLAFVLFAAVVNLLGNFFYTKALKYTGSTNVLQLHYTQIIWGAFFGYILWHEIPSWNLVLGSVIIIVSGITVAAQAHRTVTPA